MNDSLRSLAARFGGEQAWYGNRAVLFYRGVAVGATATLVAAVGSIWIAYLVR